MAGRGRIFPRQRYQHYKGGIYEVICTAKHTETDEELVIYKGVGCGASIGKTWARPIDMFSEDVYTEDRGYVPRFERLGPSIARGRR